MKIFLNNVEQKLDFPLTLAAPAPYTLMIKFDSEDEEDEYHYVKVLIIESDVIKLWDLWEYKEDTPLEELHLSEKIWLDNIKGDIHIITHKYVGRYDKPLPQVEGKLMPYSEFKAKYKDVDFPDYTIFSECVVIHNDYSADYDIMYLFEHNFDEEDLSLGAIPTHIFIPDSVVIPIILPYELEQAGYSSITDNDEFNEDFYWVIPKELSKRSHTLVKYIKSSNVFKTFDQTELQIDDILAVKFVEYP